MIKNFDELKKQLQELSAVINSFKSEAVQLRLVELILQVEAPEGAAAAPATSDSSSSRKRPAKKGPPTSRASRVDRASAAGQKPGRARKGAAAVLQELIDDGFFQAKRTINAIIEQARSQKARVFKANELSGPLARFIRDKRLKRQKNTDGQFEYHK